jgi:hypothetical protein
MPSRWVSDQTLPCDNRRTFAASIDHFDGNCFACLIILRLENTGTARASANNAAVCDD